MKNIDINESEYKAIITDSEETTNIEKEEKDDYVYPNESFENGKVIVLDGAKLPKKW